MRRVFSRDQLLPSLSRSLLRLWLRLLLLLLVIGVCWFAWLYRQITVTAKSDNARPADAIAVFGAAEYSGHPSPVFHSRLDKALSLYQRHLAPLVITLGGGSTKDSGNTEGAAGRDYLLANGVPGEDILAETTSVDTEQQVDDLSVIAVEHHLRSMIVVSDGTHLFRIALLCRRAGLTVYTSPRAPLGNMDDLGRAQRLMHEMLSTTSVALNLHFSALHRWLAGKGD